MRPLRREDFVWDEFNWKASTILPVWQGFQSRRGPYDAQDSLTPSDGLIDIVVGPEGRDDSPLLDSELEQILWVTSHAQQMQHALLARLLLEWPRIRADYAGIVEPEHIPPIQSARDFRTLIGLNKIFIHTIRPAAAPYAGFEFGCNWEEEHGLGVLMHGTRVVEIGDADIAFMLWVAKRDADGQ